MSEKYYVRVNDEVQGPFTEEQIGDLHADHKVTKDTPCRSQFAPDWKTVDDFLPNVKWTVAPALAPAGGSDRGFPVEPPPLPSLPPPPAPRATPPAGPGSKPPESSEMARNAVVAGWLCLGLSCLIISFPFFQAGAIASGIIAMVNGDQAGGSRILIVSALMIVIFPFALVAILFMFVGGAMMSYLSTTS